METRCDATEHPALTLTSVTCSFCPGIGSSADGSFSDLGSWNGNRLNSTSSRSILGHGLFADRAWAAETGAILIP